MQLKDLLTDDDAVSPVIGVILMVAITVILAAVIAAFVLGLGDTNSVAPNTSFEYEYNQSTQGSIDVRVASGDTFNSDRITFTGAELPDSVEGEDFTAALGGTTDVTAGTSVVVGNISVDGSSTTISGNTVGGTTDADVIPPDYLLELTFTSESGDTSSVISTREGPNR